MAHITMNIPEPPEGATHYNPTYSLKWEKHIDGNDNVYVLDTFSGKWGNPITRTGGQKIITN